MPKALRVVKGVEIDATREGAVWPLTAFQADQYGLGPLVVSSAGDGREISCWNAETGQNLWKSGTGIAECNGLCVVPSGGRLVLGVAHGEGVEHWDALTGEEVARLPSARVTSVWDLAGGLLPDGRAIFVGAGQEHLVHRWFATADGFVPRPLVGHRNSVKAVTFGGSLNQAPLIASADESGFIRRWDAMSGQEIGAAISIPDGFARQLAFVSLSNGRCLLVSVDSEGTFCRWDALSGEPVAKPQMLDLALPQMAVACAGGRTQLLTSGEDERVRLWDVDSGGPIETSLVGVSVAALKCSDGRTMVACGNYDGGISVSFLD